MIAAHGGAPEGRPLPSATVRRLGIFAVVFAAFGPPLAVGGWLGLFGGMGVGFLTWLIGIALSITAVAIAIVGLTLGGTRRLFVAALVVPLAYAVLVAGAFIALRLSVAS